MRSPREEIITDLGQLGLINRIVDYCLHLLNSDRYICIINVMIPEIFNYNFATLGVKLQVIQKQKNQTEQSVHSKLIKINKSSGTLRKQFTNKTTAI